MMDNFSEEEAMTIYKGLEKMAEHTGAAICKMNEEEKKATIQISEDIQNGQISFRNFNNPAEVTLNSTIYVVM